MSSEIIKVPDIGGSEGVEIIEISVQAGDTINAEDTMIVLESDKASMDIPAPRAGKVKKVLVSEGDKVSEGDDILELEAEDEEGADNAEDNGGEADESDDEQSSVKDSRGAEHLEEEAEADESDVESDEKPKKSAGKKGGKRTVEVRVPDIGGSENVEIIEIAVSEGDDISEEDALITLESDKASMDVPSPYSGKLVSLELKEGDTVSEGDLIGTMEIAGEGDDEGVDHEDEDTSDDDSGDGADHEEEADAVGDGEDDVEESDSEGGRQELRVPDIGGSENVEIIEVAVSEGDEINEEDALITLESDKASMDIPSPFKGKVVELSVKEGDTVSEGDLIGYIEVAGSKPKGGKSDGSSTKKPSSDQAASKKKSGDSAKKSSEDKSESKKSGSKDKSDSASRDSKKDGGDYGGEPGPEARRKQGESTSGSSVHAGPAVRLMARELGVELSEVKASGPKGRVLKEDVDAFVKQVMTDRKSGANTAAPSSSQAQGGAGIPPIPAVDFSKFGEIEEKPMGRLMKAGATNLHRSWLNVPHVTQFDEADITELEAFRKAMKDEAAQQGAKLTPLPFMIKAAAHALAKFPQFNVSLHPDGDRIIQKKYFHIGVAVDTPNGLMVPVIRDVDQKGIIELARDVNDLAKRAQEGKLKGDDMKGGCFTISSLGSIGGTAFTPIVNAPEVAILGVSKSQMKPVWNGSEFKPRLMCPLSLSYDHRAVNGADAARFTAYLAAILTDIRRLTM
ncbi:hypothetical protein GCM10010082_03420 [Kushneria pakistanensis]|uniref:Acetyltransferase component of pyruvate dehydrogenase complex n=1 Tax=Kushneria pakistanensis TaxID=1508770 RepID=A0ABQ3FAG6_9GAMM|nr:dihydrolipoyllysine-residue acetyltransferase [Kushneria pakistanensis]GHC16021.1 hypothetical protein GCM10010082_03420 [Kushneria pakistanensis]